MSLLAYLFPSWRHLRIAMAIVSTPFLLLFFILPESPRWLLNRGRTEEATSVVQAMFKGESKCDATTVLMRPHLPLPPPGTGRSMWGTLERHEKQVSKETRTRTLKEFFGHKRLCLMALVLVYDWTVLWMLCTALTLIAGPVR